MEAGDGGVRERRVAVDRVEAPAAVDVGGGDDAPSFADVSSPAPLKTPGSRRCSVSPTAMAVPVLMSKLRGKLGQGAKLPRKKDQLVALYNEHFAE